jgi:hypothetical protein
VLTIELSTVAFYRGEIPREIALSACSIPMAPGPQRALSAFYGSQGKQDGFVAAKAYAAAQGMKYTVIDMLVELEAQNPGSMKPDDIAAYDFLNFSRASRQLLEEIADRLGKSKYAGVLSTGALVALESQPLRAVLAKWPELVDEIIDLPRLRHLKVIAFHAVTSIGDRPISIGNVPHRHWSAITDATCRLNPTVRITLDSPI